MKKILSIFLVILSVSIVLSSAFAAKPQEPDITGKVEWDIKKLMRNSWATVSTLVQILSVACVVFAGLRYMFASADQKADIKRGLSYLVVGALIVFGATSIIKLVANAAENVAK